MTIKLHSLLIALSVISFYSCNAQNRFDPATGQAISDRPKPAKPQPGTSVAAEKQPEIVALLANKKVALLVNQTSLVGSTHLVDTLVAQKVNIKKIFAPEHGFRGGADAGEHVKDSVDPKTRIPVVSLYGDKKKPSAQDLKDIDVVVFDVQDVGARFYTFISTLHYLMDACAENGKELVVLDRPNPNGWYVDGPVLKKEFQSFVGVDPIPVVHGLTVGEYAKMLNGEKWLEKEMQCKLTVVTCERYKHADHYKLPVKPSPNLPNDIAVFLYPSLCFFEGTEVSVGRGTDYPFQVIGAPGITTMPFSFTPESKPGAKTPPQLGKTCYGISFLRKTDPGIPGIQIGYLLKMYQAYPDKGKFFLANNFIDKLAGTDELRKQVLAGKTEQEIKASWAKDLEAFKVIRKKYLLYEDFE